MAPAAVQAVDRAGGEVFAQRINAGNVSGYHTLLIVHRDSNIESVDDIFENAGRLDAALGDLNSTSGFLVPDFYLFQRRGVVPSETFASVTHASYEAMVLGRSQPDRRFRHDLELPARADVTRCGRSGA